MTTKREKMDEKHIGQVVFWRDTYEGRGVALVKTYAQHPTYQLENVDGESFYWAAHLCEPASAEQAADYWKKRAKAAERRVRQLENHERDPSKWEDVEAGD